MNNMIALSGARARRAQSKRNLMMNVALRLRAEQQTLCSPLSAKN